MNTISDRSSTDERTDLDTAIRRVIDLARHAVLSEAEAETTELEAEREKDLQAIEAVREADPSRQTATWGIHRFWTERNGRSIVLKAATAKATEPLSILSLTPEGIIRHDAGAPLWADSEPESEGRIRDMTPGTTTRRKAVSVRLARDRKKRWTHLLSGETDTDAPAGEVIDQRRMERSDGRAIDLRLVADEPVPFIKVALISETGEDLLSAPPTSTFPVETILDIGTVTYDVHVE
jgi:hypothetical protein